MDEPDPRTEKKDICGVTDTDISGRIWVCIKKPHAKIYRRRNGRMIFDNNPNADRHYFVNKYPNRSYK